MKSLSKILKYSFIEYLQKVIIYFYSLLINLGLAFGNLFIFIVYFLTKLLKSDTSRFIITILITGLLANQLIQPIFTPRVSEVKVEPLYIQFVDDHYYSVNKLIYNIEVPLIPIERSIEIKFLKNYKINTKFEKRNPYIDVKVFEDSKPNFINVDSTNITIKTNGFKNKNLEQIFYVFDPIDIDTTGWFTYPEDFQWSDSKLNTGYPCQIIHSNNYQVLGYGKNMYGRYEQFFLISIKNRCNLEIRNFKLDINENKDNSQTTICDGENEGRANKNSILIELRPGEIKNILFVKDFLSEFDKRFITNTSIFFNWTYQPESKCYYAWKK